MENKRTKMQNYFAERIAQGKAQERELNADERKSEAIFVRVQTNVFDIFKTILSAGERSVGTDDEKLRGFLVEKLEQIPQSWHASLQKAETHNDMEKAHIENLKLESVAEIKAAVKRIWAE